MAEEVKISFTIDGIEKQVASVEELQDAVADLGKSAKKTAGDTKKLASEQGFIADKVAGLKKTFAGLKGDFKNAASGIKTFFKSGTTGAKVLKIALASLGIPLLIAAVVSLINYFQNFEVVTMTIQKGLNALKAIISNVAEAFKLLFSGNPGAAFDVLKNAVVEAVEATDDLFDASKRLNEIQIRNATQNAKLRQEMEGYKKILEDTTASEDDRLAALAEVTKRTKQLAQAQLEENAAAIAGLESQIKLENNEVARRDLELELAQLRADRIDQQTELNNIEFDAAKVGREIVQQRLDAEEAAAEKRKAIKDKEAADDEARKETQRQKDEQRKADLNAALAALDEEAVLAMLESDQERAYKELEIAQAKEEADLAKLGATEEQLFKVREKYARKTEDLDEAVSKNKEDLAKAEKDAAIDIAAAGFGAIANLAGESSAVGKAAAVAATVINTYKGAQSAYADTVGGPIIKGVAAAIAVATGIASVKKIVSTKVPGGKSSGGAPSISVPQAPAFDPTAALDAAAQGQDADNTIGTQQPEPVRAYVVSSEVSSQQEADSRINELARL